MASDDNPWHPKRGPGGSYGIPGEELDEQQEHSSSDSEGFDTHPINPRCSPRTPSTSAKLKVRWTPEQFTEQKLKLRKVQHGEQRGEAQDRAEQHIIQSPQQQSSHCSQKQKGQMQTLSKQQMANLELTEKLAEKLEQKMTLQTRPQSLKQLDDAPVQQDSTKPRSVLKGQRKLYPSIRDESKPTQQPAENRPVSVGVEQQQGAQAIQQQPQNVIQHQQQVIPHSTKPDQSAQLQQPHILQTQEAIRAQLMGSLPQQQQQQHIDLQQYGIQYPQIIQQQQLMPGLQQHPALQDMHTMQQLALQKQQAMEQEIMQQQHVMERQQLTEGLRQQQALLGQVTQHPNLVQYKLEQLTMAQQQGQLQHQELQQHQTLQQQALQQQQLIQQQHLIQALHHEQAIHQQAMHQQNRQALWTMQLQQASQLQQRIQPQQAMHLQQTVQPQEAILLQQIMQPQQSTLLQQFSLPQAIQHPPAVVLQQNLIPQKNYRQLAQQTKIVDELRRPSVLKNVKDMIMRPVGFDNNGRPSYTCDLCQMNQTQTVIEMFLTLMINPAQNDINITNIQIANGGIIYRIVGDYFSTFPVDVMMVDGLLIGQSSAKSFYVIDKQWIKMILQREVPVDCSSGGGVNIYSIHKTTETETSLVATITYQQGGNPMEMKCTITDVKLNYNVKAVLISCMYRLAVLNFPSPFLLRRPFMMSNQWEDLFNSTYFHIQKVANKYFPVEEFYMVSDGQNGTPLLILSVRHTRGHMIMSVYESENMELIFWMPEIMATRNNPNDSPVILNDSYFSTIGIVLENQTHDQDGKSLMRVTQEVNNASNLVIVNDKEGEVCNQVGYFSLTQTQTDLHLHTCLENCCSKALLVCLAIKMIYNRKPRSEIRSKPVPTIHKASSLVEIANTFRVDAITNVPQLVLPQLCPVEENPDWQEMRDLQKVLLTHYAIHSEYELNYYILSQEECSSSSFVLRTSPEGDGSLYVYLLTRGAASTQLLQAKSTNPNHSTITIWEEKTKSKLALIRVNDNSMHDMYYNPVLWFNSDSQANRSKPESVTFREHDSMVQEGNQDPPAIITFEYDDNQMPGLTIHFRMNLDARLKALILIYCTTKQAAFLFRQNVPVVNNIGDIRQRLYR